MKVLVCGSRNSNDYLAFCRTMNRLNEERGPFTAVIHGGAKGVDWMAHIWASRSVDEFSFPAQWNEYGRAAGPIRNARMLAEGKPDLVVAFSGGAGTRDMVRRARAAGIEVIEVPALGGAG